MEPLVLVLILLLAGAAAAVLLRRRGGPPEAPPRPVLADRLTRTRRAVTQRLQDALARDRLDGSFWEGLEDALVAADTGVEVASEVVEAVRRESPKDAPEAGLVLREELLKRFVEADRSLRKGEPPSVVVVVGVNGVGKTTTIAKLAARLIEEGEQPLLGCADTFRAAAAEQLRTWAEGLGIELVAGEPGADPAAVAYDAYQAARARGRQAVIVDTAGRLHSKHNLMEELGKVVRVLRREAGRVDEVLLVLDATIGQNAVAQARQFTEAVGVTGIVLTKLDGTARGGAVLAIERQLGLPVKFVGVGEGPEDLVPFRPGEFVDALLEPV